MTTNAEYLREWCDNQAAQIESWRAMADVLRTQRQEERERVARWRAAHQTALQVNTDLHAQLQEERERAADLEEAFEAECSRHDGAETANQGQREQAGGRSGTTVVSVVTRRWVTS